MSGTPPRSPSPDGKRPATDVSGGKPFKFNNGWTKEQEELMAGWSDIAGCYRWMHDRCEKIMAKNNMMITVPVIILSTLTGSANFIMGSLLQNDQNGQKYAQIGIGGVSIFTGILTTLGNFFRYAQSSEAHRVASIAWGKFQRQLAVELALHPRERIDCMDFLKICRAELDRMIEQSPPIPDKVINQFENEFKDMKDLKRPDIAHGMDHTKVFVDKDTRISKLAADAAVMLKQKRKVWHQAMMPDVEHHLDKRMRDLSGNLFADLKERIAALESIVEEQAERAIQERLRARIPAASGATSGRYRSFMASAGQEQAPTPPLTARRASQVGSVVVSKRSLSADAKTTRSIIENTVPRLQEVQLDTTLPSPTPVSAKDIFVALNMNEQPRQAQLSLPGKL